MHIIQIIFYYDNWARSLLIILNNDIQSSLPGEFQW